MKTELLTPTEAALSKAAALIRAGELVAFPTETVYGLGADALSAAAVLKIFAVKGRPADNPLIVHVCSMEEAEPLCYSTKAAVLLAKAFWPGPMTLLLPKKPIVPPETNAGLASVAVRVPSHPVARALIARSGCAIAAPSANTSGRPSPTAAAHVLEDMNGKVPLILDGGPCAVGLESTVIDVTGETPTVLRPGGVTPEMIEAVAGRVSVADSVLRPLREGEKALSPGMRYRHYAPHGQLTLMTGEPSRVLSRMAALYDEAVQDGHSPALLAFEEHLPQLGQRRVFSIGRLSQPESVAAHLFAVLREMDELGADVMYSESLPPQGIGLAVMNRLSRAAAFRTLSVEEK